MVAGAIAYLHVLVAKGQQLSNTRTSSRCIGRRQTALYKRELVLVLATLIVASKLIIDHDSNVNINNV